MHVKDKVSVAVNEHITSELRGVTCQASHSVICHPTQVKAPRPNPRQAGLYSIYTYPGGMEGIVGLGGLVK